MRILMLGNSFTFANDVPGLLAELLDAEVVSFTRGGAHLSTYLNGQTHIGRGALDEINSGKWDFVALQEYSTGPIRDKERFMESVRRLTGRIHAAGATPILYATWAFKNGGTKLEEEKLDYEEMYHALHDAYHEAGERFNALVADVGKAFYERASVVNLYASDDYHPNMAGSRLAAEVIAETIRNAPPHVPVEKPEPVNHNLPAADDNRLRILYLYQLLQRYSDETHSISRPEIMELLAERGFHIHRTALPRDIEVLRAAGVEVEEDKAVAVRYRLIGRAFSTAEIRLLIDAVQSSKFLTEEKSGEMIEKLSSLTSEKNAGELRRAIHITGKPKSDNEKGYYIVDAINEAIIKERKISFLYFDYSATKSHVLKNGGAPYTVSPYDLIWDGDFYYMTGFCDNRGEVRTFRVDRIEKTPTVLKAAAVPRPRGYRVEKYTQEVFRMFATQNTVKVALICRDYVMKSIIDKFGKGVRTKNLKDGTFRTTVKVCISPTFYRWVFASNGSVIIEAPEDVRREYRKMLLEEATRYQEESN